MVVRLAYERGYLTTRNPNRIQSWGLIYFQYMDKRQRQDDARAIQELQTFELNFDRWKFLHGLADKEMVGGEAYTGVTDSDAVTAFLDSYADTLEAPREMGFSDVGDGYYGLEV